MRLYSIRGKPVFPAVPAVSKLANSCYRPRFLPLGAIFLWENSSMDLRQITLDSGGQNKAVFPTVQATSRLANWCNRTYFLFFTIYFSRDLKQILLDYVGHRRAFIPASLDTSRLANWFNRPYFLLLWSTCLPNTLQYITTAIWTKVWFNSKSPNFRLQSIKFGTWPKMGYVCCLGCLLVVILPLFCICWMFISPFHWQLCRAKKCVFGQRHKWYNIFVKCMTLK